MSARPVVCLPVLLLLLLLLLSLLCSALPSCCSRLSVLLVSYRPVAAPQPSNTIASSLYHQSSRRACVLQGAKRRLRVPGESGGRSGVQHPPNSLLTSVGTFPGCLPWVPSANMHPVCLSSAPPPRDLCDASTGCCVATAGLTVLRPAAARPMARGSVSRAGATPLVLLAGALAALAAARPAQQLAPNPETACARQESAGSTCSSTASACVGSSAVAPTASGDGGGAAPTTAPEPLVAWLTDDNFTEAVGSAEWALVIFYARWNNWGRVRCQCRAAAGGRAGGAGCCSCGNAWLPRGASKEPPKFAAVRCSRRRPLRSTHARS